MPLRRTLLAVSGAALGLAPGAAGQMFTAAHGLRPGSVRQLDSRLIALSVRTAALPGPANIRILLPTGYASHSRRRYPVLYLIHGTSGGAADWTKMGAAERTTAGRPLIVVMPDIGLHDDGGGWCTNWPGGLYHWETFHISQLIPWVDANLRTVRSRAGRAIAGLSQGGFCSTSYAARHPDLFGAALSYSGAPDIAYDAEAQALVTPVINATETGLDHVPPNSMFGPRSSNEINWAAHDPTTLAANLRDTRLAIYTGNGKPGPFDSGPNPGASAIEAGVEQLTQLFHHRLKTLRIPSVYDDYGPGTHSWPYWARDLRWSIGWVMHNFAHPLPAPATVTFMSADGTYSVYGWRVITHRRVREFSTLVGATRHGFKLQGSGSATVRTARLYAAGRRYTITIRDGGRRRVRRARADSRGRLTLKVPLGPSDTVQEYPMDGPPVGTTIYTTRVSIR